MEPELDRLSGQSRHVGTSPPGDQPSHAGLTERVTVVETVTGNRLVVGSQDLDPDLSGMSSPTLEGRPQVEPQLAAGKGEGPGNGLAEGQFGAVQRNEAIQRQNRQTDGSVRPLFPQHLQLFRGSPVHPAVVEEDLLPVDGGPEAVDRHRIEGLTGPGRYERSAVAAVIVDAIPAEDELGQDRGVRGPEVPEHSEGESLVGSGVKRVELGVGVIVAVGKDDRNRLAPADHVGALRAPDDAFADGTSLMAADLHVRDVDSMYWIPSHHRCRSPAAPAISPVDDGIAGMGRPVEGVAGVVEMELHSGASRVVGQLPPHGLHHGLVALRRIRLPGVEDDATLEPEPVVFTDDVVVPGSVELHQSQ